MLIVVVLVFVVCQTPALATQLLLVLLGDDAKSCPRPFFYYERLSDLLVVANSSVNFIIYCFCSRTFRQTVVAVVCRQPHQQQHQQQQHQLVMSRVARPLEAEPISARAGARRSNVAVDYVATLDCGLADGGADSKTAAV